MGQSYKKTEKKLKGYLTGKLDTQIQRRKDILKFPSKPSIDKKGVVEFDIKTDGTKPRDKLGNEVAKRLDDKKYHQLQSDHYTIKRFIKYVQIYDKTAYEVLDLFYGRNKSWVYIAQKLNLSETSCKDRRKKYIEELSEWLITV